MNDRPAPPRHLRVRRRPRPRRLSSLFLAAVVCLAGWLVAAAPSDAASVPDSRCARYDHGLRTGICFADSRGALYWLGTYRGYDGVELYCIDYLYATDWGVAHQRRVYTDGIPTSVGGQVGKATAAALTYLVTRHPANTADDTTAAAIGLLIREVMGDVRNAGGRPIPGGLTASTQVRDVGFVSDAVVRRARVLWEEAKAHRGPWQLSAKIDPGPDGKVTVGERVRAVLRGTNGWGGPQDMRAALTYRGFRGPSAVTLGADGVATITLVAPRVPGSGSMLARVTDAPSPNPIVVRPNDWRTNPRPGHSFAVTQRGLIGRRSVVTASASAAAVVVKLQPRLSTQASARRVEPGATIYDSVLVAGTGGNRASFGWSLIGPVAPLANGSCPATGHPSWATARRLAYGAVATTRDGTYRTAPYRVGAGDVGCLTYVESMPGSALLLPTSTSPGAPAETLLVARPKTQPRLVTRASAQRVEPGASVGDEVDVTGTGGATGSFAWSLLGPVPPLRDGSCPGAGDGAWDSAKTLASGTVGTRGDGTYPTEPYVVRPGDAGCLTYVESMPGTATTLPAQTRPGVPAETVLVTRPAVPPPVRPAARPRLRPCVSTVASRQRALVGNRLHDLVRVGCIRTTDRVVVHWTAHGPLAPVAGTGELGCDRIRAAAWRHAPVAARGSIVVTGPGSRATRAFAVRKPGCYTFSESVPGTTTTTVSRTEPGLAAETSIVTRPALPVVPEVPTGYRIGTDAGPREPGPVLAPTQRLAPRYTDRAFVRGGGSGARVGVLRIRSLGMVAPVEAVSMRDGVMAVPDSPSRLGWLRQSARRGDVIGSSVIAGHVSDAHDRPGAFAGLGRIRKGARIVWTDAHGRDHRFVVTTVSRFPRKRGLPSWVFRTDGGHKLRLVTCTHRVRLPGGGFHYTDNLVVTAKEVRRRR